MLEPTAGPRADRPLGAPARMGTRRNASERLHLLEFAGTRSGVLKDLFREHLPGFLAEADAHGVGLPRHIRRELERFVGCGEPESGFAWLQCRACDHHRLVPFSCKGRGFCPSCGGRRMAAFAANTVDRVLPRVPVRQWVLTLPWTLRLLADERPYSGP